MKKLKFLALGLAGLMAFASCSKDDEETAANFEEKSYVFGGASRDDLPSFYTYDNGAQTKTQLGETGANVVFAFQSLDDNYRFISGTIAKNQIVNSTASETNFVLIGDATAKKFESADFSEKATSINIDKKIEKGKKAIAFKNETLKVEGFFEVTAVDTEKDEITVTVYTKK